MMLKNSLILSCLVLALCVFACAPKSPSDFNKEQDLYEYALDLFKRRNYSESVKFFESFRNRYPKSPYISEAEYMLAESHFKNRDYIEAVYSFQNFITLHPTNSKVPQAHFYIAQAHFKQAPGSIDRDQTNTANGISVLRELLAKYPNFEKAGEAKSMLERAALKMARREMYIADFYLKQKSYKAAIGRYEYIKNNFYFADIRHEALYKLALSYHRLKDMNAAAEALGELLAAKPKGEYAKKADDLAAKIKTGEGS